MAPPVLNSIDWTCNYFINNQIECMNIIKDANLLKELPSLNSAALHNLKDGQLVRFQGMIQDMYNPELYFQKYEVKNSTTGESTMRNGMYRDTALCQEHEDITLDSKSNVSAERQTFVVMSVPGLNDWAREKSTDVKRSVNSSSSTSVKRILDDDKSEPMDTVEPVTKKEKSEHAPSQSEKTMSVSREHLLNFPIPTSEGRACIVKVYEESTPFKLNQIVDIIGFISLDPIANTVTNTEEMMEEAEMQTHNPPASLIPRLHAITVTQSSQNISVPSSPQIMSRIQAIRSDLRMVLSQILFGDDLAADFMISHLFSRIYLRKNDLCLGNFPLNITNFPTKKYPNFVLNFYNILTDLIPKSHYFECTLENLNNCSLIPKKDYDCNRLTSGILQLSSNTHLIIDETNLTTGQLSPQGRKNYQAISDLLIFQKVTYDFKFYTMEHEADIPILILSETKSFLPCIIQVPLKIDPETENLYPQVMDAAKQFLKNEERLNDIRHYLELLRKTEFQINEDITATIQEDFVTLRQSDKTVNADNLHQLMVLARLMALSHGENSLTINRWKETLEMETERLARLKHRLR